MKYEKYFVTKKVNQENLNKKINYLFDIKTLFLKKSLTKKKINFFVNQIREDFLKLSYKDKKREKIKILSKKVNLSHIKNRQIKKVINSARNLKLNLFFQNLVVQGSVASDDCIKNWSDIDIFGVLKSSVILDQKSMIKLTYKLKKFYSLIYRFNKLQHHGIIIYTEFDLLNYLSGYLPPQAFKNNFNLFENQKIIFFLDTDKINLSKKILINRRNFLKNAINVRKYDHHVINKVPKLPFKKNDKSLYQLFYHIGTILNIPILFLDAKGKSSHKKASFNKFYKIIKNKFIIDFIKKHEKIRINWKKFYTNEKIVSKRLVEELGKNYLKNCLKVYNILIKKL